MEGSPLVIITVGWGSPTIPTLHSALRRDEMLWIMSTQQVLNEELYLSSLFSMLYLMGPLTSLPLGGPHLSRL